MRESCCYLDGMELRVIYTDFIIILTSIALLKEICILKIDTTIAAVGIRYIERNPKILAGPACFIGLIERNCL